MIDRRLWLVTTLVWLAPERGAAQTPSPAPIPSPVRALEGCWRGTGEAVGKHVAITLTSRAILDQAMLIVDVESNALGNVSDRYSAHLVFGGLAVPFGGSGADVVSFWSDTFGGAYAIMGQGRSTPDGFAVTYAYPDASFVNRWRRQQDRLTWTIVQRDHSGSEKTFATYALAKVTCP